MSTIRTGIALNDQMTNVLKSVYSSINMTVRAMEGLSNQMRDGFDPKAIKAARAAVQQTEAAIKNLPPPIDDAERRQDRFNRKLKDGEGAASGLLGQLAKIAAVLAPFFAVGKVIGGGFDRLIGIDTAQAKLTALGHTAESVASIMDNALEAVSGTAFRMEDAVNTAAGAVAAGVKSGKQLERYLSLTADAAAIAGTNMGEMGAIFNKITTSGKIQSEELNQLSDRGIPIFQMLADEMGVAAQEVRKLATQGKISSAIFLNAVERGFGGAAKTMGTASFQATLDNIGAAISRIGASFLKGTEEGSGFFGQLKPLMVDVLNMLKSFESQAAVIGDAVGRVFKFLIDNMETVKMVLVGLGVTAATVATIWLVKWMIAAWPVFAIIAGVTLLMVVLSKLGVTADQVVGFITGLFTAFYVSVHNQIAMIWNFIAAFVEFFANVFNEPVYSIKKLFHNLATSIIDAIYKIAEAIDWVFGSSLASGLNSLQENLDNWLGEMPEGYKVIERMELLGHDAILDGYETGANFAKGITNALDGFDPGDVSRMLSEGVDISNIDKVGEVGKIRDTVDISSEDLKMMRELAEMRNIQNFVTLTPQISVQTGDIRETVDTQAVIASITDQLATELESSARGVYA